MDSDLLPAVSHVRAQIVTETALRLAGLAKLKSVYLVPAESVDTEAWSGRTNVPGGQSDEEFGRSLGKHAAIFLARELANALVLDRIVNPKRQAAGSSPKLDHERLFRIGVAGGSTIYGIVEHFQPGREVPTDKCVITPLVVGPIPETVYSAGFIAEILKRNLPGSTALRVSQTCPMNARRGEVYFQVAMDPDFQQARDGLPPVTETAKRCQALAAAAENKSKDAKTLCFNWVITGVGSVETGQLAAHLDLLYGRGARPANVVGDICSRLFDACGTEFDEVKGNSFVAVTLPWLSFLSQSPGHRVIAVAGGLKKYAALLALLKLGQEGRGVFNVLITDELTARHLLRGLRAEKKAAGHAKPS